MLKKLLNTNDDLSTLLLRVGIAVVMFPHGAQKLLGWFGGYGYSGTMGFFTAKLGIPAPLTFLVIFLEFFGAIAILLGLLTRLNALGIFSIMLVSMFMLHIDNGFFMNWSGAQKGEGIEFHLLMIFMSLVLVFRGAGAASVDKIISKKLK